MEYSELLVDCDDVVCVVQALRQGTAASFLKVSQI